VPLNYLNLPTFLKSIKPHSTSKKINCVNGKLDKKNRVLLSGKIKSPAP
jgi:hypothetical protein